MANMAVEVIGLDDLRRELRRVDSRLAKQMQKANKAISTEVTGDARSRVSGLGGRRFGQAAGGIRPRAKQNEAMVVLLASNPLVRSAVFGAKVHRVFGRTVLATSMANRVWRQWVGKDWNPESDLYGVSPAIKEAIPMILDTYADRVIDALAAAFPD